jgi:hypothetical protein
MACHSPPQVKGATVRGIGSWRGLSQSAADALPPYPSRLKNSPVA